jgi:hypothetical protein
MIIGTVFTLFVVPSVYVLVARTREAVVPVEKPQAVMSGLAEVAS